MDIILILADFGFQKVTIMMNKPLTFMLPDNKIKIALVGCGGTGSFIAQDIARIAYHQKQKGKDIDITFVDFDFVEEKNVGRQNFVYSEIGKNKAETLALRYNMAYGLKISFDLSILQNNRLSYLDGEINIVVGAVDNNKARKVIHKIAEQQSSEFLWLDCGNYHNGGQILLGNSFFKEKGDYRLNLCRNIPYPSVQFKELIRKEKEIKVSCADAVLREEQTLMINRAMATFAGQYLYELIVKREINKYQTFINLNGCCAKTNFLNKNMWEIK